MIPAYRVNAGSSQEFWPYGQRVDGSERSFLPFPVSNELWAESSNQARLDPAWPPPSFSSAQGWASDPSL